MYITTLRIHVNQFSLRADIHNSDIQFDYQGVFITSIAYAGITVINATGN